MTHLLEDGGGESLVHAADAFLRENHLRSLPHARVGADQLGLQRLNLHPDGTRETNNMSTQHKPFRNKQQV